MEIFNLLIAAQPMTTNCAYPHECTHNLSQIEFMMMQNANEEISIALDSVKIFTCKLGKWNSN